MKTMPWSILRWVMAFACLAAVNRAYAEDVYFFEDLDNLKITEGKLPTAPEVRDPRTRFNDTYDFQTGWYGQLRLPYAVLDDVGEVYVGMWTHRSSEAWWKLAVRAPSGKKVTGRLWLVNSTTPAGMSMIRFEIDPAKGTPENREAFLRVKRSHYEQLAAAQLPGAAWFRYQRNEAERELGISPDERQDFDERRFVRSGRSEAFDTFSLATGGQALAENLQLDRVMPRTKAAWDTIDIEKIDGVTVREFDWTEHVKDKKPQVDTLAAAIPADQHAVFFPTFDALMALADYADRFGTPIFRAAEPRSDDAKVRQRYERQLCLPSSALSRMLGPKLIDGVALTGGDPYLLMGSDVAILFEAKDRVVLTGIINARVALAGREYKTTEAVSGEIDGVKYHGMKSPDRAICSYVATLDNTVVVTNSLAQLKRLVDVRAHKTQSLISLGEYKFFRDRYQLGDANESGLLILSDATIRRWCGPKWRIADSRRVRAAAVMSDLQARHLERVVKQDPQTLATTPNYALPDAGDFEITAGGVRSSVYGELDFMTPIGEIDLARVTAEEARLYGLWRDGYQRNWSRFFDPIAVRFFVSKDKLAIDTTVMPLIAATEYAEIIDISRGAKLAPTAGDPHAEAALHWAMALDTNSSAFRRNTEFYRIFSGNEKLAALDWIGPSVSIYADRDPVWEELAKHHDGPASVLNYVDRLPVALRVEVHDGLKLTLFLTALRGYIEGTAPELTTWEVRKHKDVPYVCVAVKGLVLSALYYTANDEALTITPREDVLQRAIERKLARDNVKRDNAKKEGGEAESPAGANDGPRQAHADAPSQVAKPWLGDHWCLRIDQSALRLLDVAFSERQQDQMQRLAWANLPILNEWRRRYPTEDSVALHERLWHRQLVCPGGGEYRWNEKWQTYESTVYGHPGEPKTGPTLAAGLRDIQSGDFGLTFEPQGLRARVELLRADASKDAPADVRKGEGKAARN